MFGIILESHATLFREVGQCVLLLREIHQGVYVLSCVSPATHQRCDILSPN